MIEGYSEAYNEMKTHLSEGEKITPKEWKKRLCELEAMQKQTANEAKPYIGQFAYAEVLEYNSKNEARERENERDHQRTMHNRHIEQGERQ